MVPKFCLKPSQSSNGWSQEIIYTLTHKSHAQLCIAFAEEHKKNNQYFIHELLSARA